MDVNEEQKNEKISRAIVLARIVDVINVEKTKIDEIQQIKARIRMN